MEEIAEYSGFELKKADAVFDKERTFLHAWDRMGGKSEGQKAGREETALRMLRDGVLPVEKIAEYSGLEAEEVERLVKAGKL